MNRELHLKGYLKYFFIPYALFFITLSVLLMIYNRRELHLLLNAYHTPELDTFFKIVTNFGGSIPFFIVVGLLLYRLGASLYLLVSLGANALVTNSLKLIFAHLRPRTYFSENFPDITLPLVRGVELFGYNGFPSGHTSSAFLTMLCLTLLSKNRVVAFLSILLAMLTGFSRVYLNQHFADDILFGSVVGITMALLLSVPYKKLIKKEPALNCSLPRIIKTFILKK